MGQAFSIYVYGNSVSIEREDGRSAGQSRWSIFEGNPSYTGPVPTTARKHFTLSDGKYTYFLVFRVPPSDLDTDFLIEQLGAHPSVKNNELQKSNVLGIAISGPFSRAARALKEAGASELYGVKSPMTLFSWTAKDFVKYCDRLVLAVQQGAKN